MKSSVLGISGPVQRAIGIGMIVIVLYLTIVVVSTPNLRPTDAVMIAVIQNWWLIGAMGLGAGTQAFLLAYAKSRACSVRHRGTIVSASGFFSGLSSFLSFLSLIPVGCCGTWIYVLSFLPGLVGAGGSSFLLRNSLQFEFLGLVSMGASVSYTYLSVRKKLGLSKLSQRQSSPKTLDLVPSALIATIVIGSAIFFAFYPLDLRPQLFRGAYAVYSGTTLISGLSSLNTTRVYRIVDSNATSIRLQITTCLGTAKLQVTSWEPYSPFTRLHLNGQIYVGEYSALQLINGRAYPRVAVVYAYGNSTVTYYYDSLTATFPVEIVMNSATITEELASASTGQC